MDQIKLVLPSEEYLAQVWACRQECLEAGSSMDGTSALMQFDDPALWLEGVAQYADPATVPEGHVPLTQFLALRESDGKLVGMIQVRHYLNEYLRTFGGHIGYSVRPSERRRGYAKEQLRLCLAWCKETLGLEKVLITCDTNNEGSRRTILANGGVYESTVHEPDRSVDMERYWLTLS